MSKLYSSHKRFIGLGLMSALVIALAVLGTLWGFSQMASAQGGTVTLVHVEPDGTDYIGNPAGALNPYCPDTDWSGGKNKPIAKPWHDCNNITSQNHVIRTVGWDGAYHSAPVWNIENLSGANATIIAQDDCGAIAEVTGRAGWDPANNTQQCVVIHSSTPGETRVTLTYDDSGTIYTTPAVVKEWDSLVGSVILKYGDLEKVKVYYDEDGDTVIGTSEYEELYLPQDVNGDGVRDTDDEDLLDRQSTWQDHGVVWDESLKRIKSPVPVQLIEIVHGEHEVLIDSVSVVVRQPTEGALVEAVIDSERGCTYFTDATGAADYGDDITGVTDNLGRFVYDGEEVYIDTVCEEQVVINFYAQYPNLPGSLRQGLHEWIGINWTTIEEAKQPQIRWAGEEIILAKRWALPDDWYPNSVPSPGTGLQDPCPLATVGGAVPGFTYNDPATEPPDTITTHHVNYVLKDPGLGALEGGYVDMDGDGSLDTLSFMGQSEAVGHIDDMCISKALADSEDPGEQDIEAKLMKDTYVCEPLVAAIGGDVAAQQGSLPGAIQWDATIGGWGCYYSPSEPMVPAELVESVLVNKHAFLVWYLKIYQVKLTNVDGVRTDHNAGSWTFGDGEDTEEDTLNVSQDALLRVTVKGWFFSEDKSSRGAVCIDMDGDGDGDDETTDDEPGVPYPVTNEDVGCADADDQMLENGHWVLPDDLVALAGPDAINTRPNWDVMSEPTASKTVAVGPKNTLDSHDKVIRPWVPCVTLDPTTGEPILCTRKTVAPDGAITEADAIMPPLKIRAEIADDDAGFLKEALKGVIYANTNDYHSIMIPADPEIPPIVNNGGYDWDSWLCRIEDGNVKAPGDRDSDGIPDVTDNCPDTMSHYVVDTDADGEGDVCDTDDDDDGVLDASDACPWDPDPACDDDDADDDTILDDADNCPLTSNATQDDADEDGVGDVCDDMPDAAPPIPSPPVVSCPQSDLEGLGLGPYPFWTIINKFGAPYPNYIEIYTDNRGEGMFFANGDFNLSFDDCRTDAVSGAPDCSPGDAVGESNITVIGDYPYFRKHSAVLSNPVVKTWEWEGYKLVTAERIDATHTAIVAHLVDRDGYCKYDVKSDPTATNGVQFSPSLHEVQHEWVEFLLNTDVGYIRDVSPNALLVGDDPTLDPHVHTPLMETRATGLEDGVIVNNRQAMARAEDGRILDYYDEARCLEEGECQALVAEEACQAWVVIEHPIDEEPNVSVVFHDPEGDINRHWPPTELLINLVQGWNDACFVDEDATVEDALAAVFDDVLAVYRFNADQTWDRYFPGRCEEEGLCTLDEENTLESYDQLFILMAASAEWLQQISALPDSVDLAGASAADDVLAAWNSVCYAGLDKPTDEATSDISSAFQIMYTLGADQAWRRYVPDRPEIPDTLTTLHQFDSVILLVTAEGGITWVFDP